MENSFVSKIIDAINRGTETDEWTDVVLFVAKANMSSYVYPKKTKEYISFTTVFKKSSSYTLETFNLIT